MKFTVYKKKTQAILTAFCIFSFILVGACTIYTYITNEPLIISIILGLFTLCTVYLFYHFNKYDYYGAYVNINEEQVEFVSKIKKVVLKWEDISEVGLTTVTGIKGVGISSKYNENLITTSVAIEYISETYIFVEFRKEVFKEIRKYWSEEIENENLYRKLKRIK